MSKDNPPKEDFTRLLKYFEEKRREDNEKNEKRFRELTAFIKNRKVSAFIWLGNLEVNKENNEQSPNLHQWLSPKNIKNLLARDHQQQRPLAEDGTARGGRGDKEA